MKIASWQKAFAIFSIPSINVINTICSIASFYSVGLEVFENEEIVSEDSSLTQYKENNSILSNSKILNAINEAAILGNWVLFIMYEFPKVLWEIINELLESLRNENKITNSFRLILDMQNTEQSSIPINVLTDQTIIYCINEENIDEMEGFNDVWANILNDKLLPTVIAASENETFNNVLTSEKSESNRFTLNNEISEISVGWKNATEQGSYIETINAFKPT